MDSQKWILTNSWCKQKALWCCSRNFGKSFLGAVFMLLKAMLYPNQSIYIVSNVGAQANETMAKIEEIITRQGKTAESCLGLKDIALYEVETSPLKPSGVSHDKTGWSLIFFNGSTIKTVTGNVVGARGKRATLVFLDEVGFSSEDLISSAEAYAAQNTEFKLDVDELFNANAQKRKCPTQILYASSAGSRDSVFFKYYKDFYFKTIMGDSNYFVADMPCEVVLEPYCDGKKIKPLLTKEKIDSAMRTNPLKARREYYNKFDTDGGINQMVKISTIRYNETLTFPEMYGDGKSEYVILFDPARAGRDASAIVVMKLVYDEELGWTGHIVNAINLISAERARQKKVDSIEQIKALRNIIAAYNGDALDYVNIYALGIDSGSGGGGFGNYSDHLMLDWKDEKGKTHKGFLDLQYKTKDLGVVYEGYDKKYPNADTSKMHLLNPKTMREIMCEEFFELMNNNLIKMPREYDGRGYINYEKEIKVTDGDKISCQTEIKKHILTSEEERALNTIDLMKSEITAINKYESSDHKSVTYRLPPEKENNGVHDDFFYCCIMAGHFLQEKRSKSFDRKPVKRDTTKTIEKLNKLNSVSISSNDNSWFDSIY